MGSHASTSHLNQGNNLLCYAVLRRSVVSNSLQPHGLQPARLLCPWDSPGKNTGVGCHSLLQGFFPTQGSNPHLLHWQAGSLPSEPPEKPKNTGVGSLSLLQGNFPTQESNWGLLHCRRILYQLRYSSNRLVIQLTHCKVLYVLEIYIGK